GGDAHLEAAVLLQHLGHQDDEVVVVVDQQHLALAALQRVGGDAVVLHEFVQGLARDAPEPRAGHPEALELTLVEAADDGVLADLADLRRLAGREYSLHALFHPSRALGPSHEWGPRPCFRQAPSNRYPP